MNARGSTLSELLIASAVLVIGLVGVVQLLIAGTNNNRVGSQAINATLMAEDTLSAATAGGYFGLAVGTFDGGTVFDFEGRRFGRIVTVGSGCDAGWPSYTVDVRVEMSNLNGGPVLVTNAGTVVSAAPGSYPDGGPGAGACP